MKNFNKENLDEFLSSEENNFEFNMIPLYIVDKALQDLGYEKGEMETNGWQVDFWLDYTKEDSSLNLAGGLFYGKFNLTKE